MQLCYPQEAKLPAPRVLVEVGLSEAGLWHLGAVGRAAALALAGILAFAALVAGLAAARSLAIVLAFTGVLGSRGLLTEAETGPGEVGRAVRGRVCRLSCNRGATGETGESCGQKQSIQLILHWNSRPRWGVGAEEFRCLERAGGRFDPSRRKGYAAKTIRLWE